MSTTVELVLTKSKQLYPKTGRYSDGEFAVVSCNVSETISGEPKISDWGNIVIVGTMPYMKNNTKYRFIGIEKYDETRRSYSYEVGYMDEYTNNLTKADFEAYLEDVLTVSQFNKAKKIPNIKLFLDNQDIQALTSIKGIGESTAKKMIEKYTENKSNASFIARLSNMGVTVAMREKLLDRYKSYGTVIDKLTNNPYILAEDVEGIGFSKADELAMKAGMSPSDPRRIRGLVYHVLNSKSIEGQSYIYLANMISAITEKIYDSDPDKVDHELVLSVLRDMYNSKKLWVSDDNEYIGLYEIYLLEKSLAKEILRLSKQKNWFNFSNWEKEVSLIEENQGWKYTEEQRQGIYTSLKDNFVMVVGKAGSGKTTVTNAMSTILSKNGYSIKQACLSGKASLRMQEVTGRESSTIHRLLEFNPKGGFARNKENPIKADVVIIDEVSMVDTKLMLSLLRAIEDKTKVIFLGDPAQLPSIGLGNIMTDLINNKGVVSVVELTQIHRQAQKSAIITKSIEMRENKQITKYGYEGIVTLGELQDLTLDITSDKTLLPQKVLYYYATELNKYKNLMDVCVVCTTKVRGELSCFKLNNLIKEWFNPLKIDEKTGKVLEDYIMTPVDKNNSYYISVGDKILVTKNNYSAEVWDDEKKDFVMGAVFNGNLGVVVEIAEGYIEIKMETGNLVRFKENKYNTIELGYAVSCHKSQGSQFRTTIVAMDMGGYSLLSSEWGYTAITRAMKKCIVVSEPNALYKCCSHNLNSLKFTFLGMILYKYLEEGEI